jgi:hypothetical protein
MPLCVLPKIVIGITTLLLSGTCIAFLVVISAFFHGSTDQLILLPSHRSLPMSIIDRAVGVATRFVLECDRLLSTHHECSHPSPSRDQLL